MKQNEYEHSEAIAKARTALIVLRKQAKKLHFISGGRGYDNMARRELEQVRTKVDELEFWLSAATRSLNAGGQRARKLGYGPETWGQRGKKLSFKITSPEGETTITIDSDASTSNS